MFVRRLAPPAVHRPVLTPALSCGPAPSTRFNLAGVSLSRARHTVGAEATGPEHLLLLVAQGVDIGDRLPTTGEHGGYIDQHLPAVVTPRTKPRRDRAPESWRVRPTCSAGRRTAVPPA